jgi:hypothetical protein
MNIYLDTNLWNALCDQAVDPERFMRRLASKNVNRAPGIHIFYELTKTFRSSDTQTQDRGKKLLSYFKKFIDGNTNCVKDNMELLAAEMWALKLRTPNVEVFLSKEDRALVSQEARKLAGGEVSERAVKFLQEQGEFASTTRSNQVKHLKGRAEMKDRLKAVSPEQFEPWLRIEATSHIGVAVLFGLIQYGSDKGGRTGAVLSSLIASCKRQHIEPFAYLRDLFMRISSHPHHRLDELLPDRWHAAQSTTRP